MNSGNHVMLLGDLIIWEYEYLGGIRALEPGYSKIQMHGRRVFIDSICKVCSKIPMRSLRRLTGLIRSVRADSYSVRTREIIVSQPNYRRTLFV